MDLQAMINTMNEIGRQERSNYHLTLGGLIDALKGFPAHAKVVFDFNDRLSPCEPDSYRGYYSDLAFAACPEELTVTNFLVMAEECLGKTFYGYKGGEYEMSKDTPLWQAGYGSTGYAIMGIHLDGDCVLIETKQVD
jgi:hypothetical protein